MPQPQSLPASCCLPPAPHPEVPALDAWLSLLCAMAERSATCPAAIAAFQARLPSPAWPSGNEDFSIRTLTIHSPPPRPCLASKKQSQNWHSLTLLNLTMEAQVLATSALQFLTKRKPYMCFIFCFWFSVAQSCLTDCDPVDCCTPDLPVPHHLPKFAQVHVHCAGDAIQPSHPLLPSSPSALSFSQHQELFQWVSCSHQGTKILERQVLPTSIQGWFPLRLTGWISLLSKGLSEVFSSTTVQGHQFLVFCLLYGPAFTAVHDHWEDHSLD